MAAKSDKKGGKDDLDVGLLTVVQAEVTPEIEEATLLIAKQVRPAPTSLVRAR